MNLSRQSLAIIDDFSGKAEPEFLTLIIDDLIVDKLIHDCHFIIDINNKIKIAINRVTSFIICINALKKVTE